MSGYDFVPTGEILEAVRTAAGKSDLAFVGDFFELTRSKRPEVAEAGRKALSALLSKIPHSTDPKGAAPEVSLVARVRALDSHYNIRRAIREELARSGIVVVRPGSPPPRLFLLADFREKLGDAYEDVPGSGFVSGRSVRMELTVWLLDAVKPQVLGWVRTSAHARPPKATQEDLYQMSGEALRRNLAESGLDRYVLAAGGRREAFSDLLLKRGLDDPLRMLAESTGFQPASPEERARFLMADGRYADCARLGKAGLDLLVPVYRELSYRDDDRPELEVARAIVSVEAPELAATLRDLVAQFPVGTLMDTDYLRIDKQTAVVFLERLAQVGTKADAAAVERWMDPKWGREVSDAAKRAKEALVARE